MFPNKKYLVRYKYKIENSLSKHPEIKEESRIQKAQSPEDAVEKTRINLFKERRCAHSFSLIDIHKI